MRPVQLSVEGFRCFRQESVLEFPARPGLYQVRGVNRLEPDLGANGVGKSTLVCDGLTYAYFGRTSRRLRGRDVESWDHEGQTVVSVLHDDGRELIRSRNPSGLSLGGEVVTQEELEEELGWNFETWTHAVVVSQFADFFLDQRPAEKLDLFSRVLDLDRWTRLSKVARARSIELSSEVDKLAAKIEESEKLVSVLEGHLADARRARKTWRRERDAEVERLGKRVEGLEGRLPDVVDAVRLASNDLRKARDEQADLEDDLARLDKLSRYAEREVRDLETGLGAAKTDLARLEHDRRDAADGTCPTCGQDLPDGADLEERLEEQLGEARLRVEGIEADLKKARERLGSIEEEKLEVDELLDVRVPRVEEARRAHDEAATLRRSLEDDARVALGRLEALRAEEGPNHERITRDLEDARKVLDARRARLKVVREEHDGVAYWPGGFRDLRLWIVEDALAQLEVEVNSSLLELGLVDWRVTFEVQKAGGRPGFTVTVQSPESRGPVPWEGWSGGETQRLRLAGAVGFGDLIRARRGLDLPLEVWDEPTQHLSEDGIDDLLRFFEARARSEGRQVWLVDHRSLDVGMFDRTLTVVKDREGSWLSTRIRPYAATNRV